MTDDPNEGAAVVPREDPPPPVGAEGQYELWREMIDVERQRIQMRDRQFDLLTEAVGMANAADERQFKFQSDRLQRDDDYRKSRLGTFTKMGWALLIAAIAFVCLILYMVFWGTESQQGGALVLAAIAGTATATLFLGIFVGQRLRSS